jgi:hypothetical protein
MSVANIRFMFHNWIKDTTPTISSEQTDHPVSDMLLDSRSKYWSTSGRFTITENNNKLYYYDTGSQVSSIATGEYLTPDLLADAIESVLNSDSTGWSVEFDSSYLFNIACDNTAILELSSDTSAIWETIGFEAGVDSDATYSFLADRIAIHTSESIEIDMGTSLENPFIGIISPLGQDFAISASGTIEIFADDLPIQESGNALEQVLPFSNAGCFAFLEGNYRYWKIKFTDPTNNNGPILKFSNIFIGPYLELNKRNIAKGFDHVINDESVAVRGESGNIFFNEKVKFDSFSNINVQFLDQTNKDLLDDMFRQVGNSKPLFISIDPDLTISSNIDKLTVYARIIGSPKFAHQIKDYFTASFGFDEVK